MEKIIIIGFTTPVTAASTSVAAATVPNVRKMPAPPPAPFVPTPLPNIEHRPKWRLAGGQLGLCHLRGTHGCLRD
jgi:hypothetical protein